MKQIAETPHAKCLFPTTSMMRLVVKKSPPKVYPSDGVMVEFQEDGKVQLSLFDKEHRTKIAKVVEMADAVAVFVEITDLLLKS